MEYWQEEEIVVGLVVSFIPFFQLKKTLDSREALLPIYLYIRLI
jgi:hypothetical protein